MEETATAVNKMEDEVIAVPAVDDAADELLAKIKQVRSFILLLVLAASS